MRMSDWRSDVCSSDLCACELQPHQRYSAEAIRGRRSIGDYRDAKVRVEQGQQVLLRRDLMRGRVDDVIRFQAGLELFDHLTFGVDQQGIRGKVRELDSASIREHVRPIDDEVQWFIERREGIEARPGLIKRTADCTLRRALFE